MWKLEGQMRVFIGGAAMISSFSISALPPQAGPCCVVQPGWNSQSSCLSFLHAGFTRISQHAQQWGHLYRKKNSADGGCLPQQATQPGPAVSHCSWLPNGCFSPGLLWKAVFPLLCPLIWSPMSTALALGWLAVLAHVGRYMLQQLGT